MTKQEFKEVMEKLIAEQEAMTPEERSAQAEALEEAILPILREAAKSMK